MTLSELVTFICNKVNQSDAVSQGICRDFINARYQMIWSGDNWKDAMRTLFASTLGGIGDYDLLFGTALDRLVTLQLLPPSGFPDRFSITLESVTKQFIIETYPELENGTVYGVPKYYEEFIDRTDNVRKIRLYPAPDKAYIYKLHGKAVFTELADDDSPLIRNIDNCLIAYATFDMLERARQYGKAKVKLEEAGALLEAMRKTENEISNIPRKSKNITVSGDSLSEMTDAVCCRIGDYSEPTRIVIKEYLRRNYTDLWDSQAWLESLVMARVPRDGSEVILPEYFDRVIACRANSELEALVPADQSLYFGVAPQVFEQSGSPVNFSFLTSSSVAALPVGTEQMQFVSSDNADISNIFVRGEVGGVEVSETVTLNGTTPAFTANVYDMPMTTAKGITRGYIDVTGRISGTFLVRLLADERERKHIRLWLQPTPTDAQDGTECLVLGKRRIHPLVTDEDTPLLRGIANVLINSAAGDWFEKIGNDKSAAACATKARGSLDVMIDRETKQTANAPRIIPFIDTPFGDDGIGFAYC